MSIGLRAVQLRLLGLRWATGASFNSWTMWKGLGYSNTQTPRDDIALREWRSEKAKPSWMNERFIVLSRGSWYILPYKVLILRVRTIPSGLKRCLTLGFNSSPTRSSETFCSVCHQLVFRNFEFIRSIHSRLHITVPEIRKAELQKMNWGRRCLSTSHSPFESLYRTYYCPFHRILVLSRSSDPSWSFDLWKYNSVAWLIYAIQSVVSVDTVFLTDSNTLNQEIHGGGQRRSINEYEDNVGQYLSE